MPTHSSPGVRVGDRFLPVSTPFSLGSGTKTATSVPTQPLQSPSCSLPAKDLEKRNVQPDGSVPPGPLFSLVTMAGLRGQLSVSQSRASSGHVAGAGEFISSPVQPIGLLLKVPLSLTGPKPSPPPLLKV